MSGALMQLATYGTQDFMLSGNPQISFFPTIGANRNLGNNVI